MKCPKCNSRDSRVRKSVKFVDHVYRRRVCRKCGDAYTTREISGDLVDKLAEKLVTATPMADGS